MISPAAILLRGTGIMISVHLIANANAHLYRDEMDAYFRTRHEIYVRERGWKALDRPDGREIDQFDTARTSYVVAMDGSKIVGGMRLVPTLCPTLLSDLFPELSLRGAVKRSDIYELSRFFVTRERRGEQTNPRVEALVQCATMEYGVATGLRQFSIVCETWCVPLLQDQGWRTSPLGVPVELDGMSTMAVLVEISEQAVRAIRECRSIVGSILTVRGMQLPEPLTPALVA
jgi:acyl-homoserine lactone synthase